VPKPSGKNAKDKAGSLNKPRFSEEGFDLKFKDKVFQSHEAAVLK
jgi:hypothetical protein